MVFMLLFMGRYRSWTKVCWLSHCSGERKKNEKVKKILHRNITTISVFCGEKENHRKDVVRWQVMCVLQSQRFPLCVGGTAFNTELNTQRIAMCIFCVHKIFFLSRFFSYSITLIHWPIRCKPLLNQLSPCIFRLQQQRIHWIIKCWVEQKQLWTHCHCE